MAAAVWRKDRASRVVGWVGARWVSMVAGGRSVDDAPACEDKEEALADRNPGR